MGRERDLAKNTVVLMFGTVVPKFVSIITLPILTGYLSTADYGTYDLVVSSVSLVLPLATLQLQAAAFRFLIEAKGDDRRRRGIITNILVVTVGISVAVLVVLFLLLGSLDVLTRLLICGYYLFDILVATLRQMARGLSKNEVYSVSVIANAVVEGLGIAGFVLLLSAGLKGALLASLLGQLVSLVFLWLSVGISGFLDASCLSLAMTKELFAYSWPMVPNSLSSWVISTSDKLVLTLMIGVEASAIYSAASKIPHILNIVQSSFNLAWQENASISRNDKDKDSYYSRVFDDVFCLIAGALSLLIAASPLLFSILIKGDYEESYVHMNILFLGAFGSCVSSFLGGVYVAHMETKSIGITTTVVAVLNLIAKLVLVPFLGVYAASITYVAGFALLALYRGFDVQRFQPIRFRPLKIGAVCVVMVAMVAVSSTRTVLAYILCCACGVALAAVLNWRMIKRVVRMLGRSRSR